MGKAKYHWVSNQSPQCALWYTTSGEFVVVDKLETEDSSGLLDGTLFTVGDAARWLLVHNVSDEEVPDDLEDLRQAYRDMEL